MDEIVCWLMIVGIFLAGIVVGLLIGIAIIYKHSIGTLRVDDSDGQIFLFLELDKGGFGKIVTEKVVSMRVNTKNYLPRN